MTRRPRTRLPALLLAGLAVLVLVPVGRAMTGADDEPARRSAAASTSARPSATPQKAGTTRTRTLTPVTTTAAVPRRVVVPRLHIDSALDRLGTGPGGELDRPPRWQVAGWYAGGPRPGETGPAVIAGHVDSPDGPAVFARLSEIRPGDRVQVRGRDGRTRTFRVDRTETSPKRGFPTQAVYGPTPDAQLRLVTCDGTYDARRGGYQDNLIVFATKDSS